jgi:hypothetical protein
MDSYSETMGVLSICSPYYAPYPPRQVDLREVKNGGPAACGSPSMALKKIPCPHAHVAAAKAGVDLLITTSSVLKTAHWKQQYEGLDFLLPSTAQIEAHAELYDEPICLHPALIVFQIEVPHQIST